MYCTHKQLKNAIGYICPEFKVLVNEGIEYNVPSWLKIVAEKYFREHFQHPDWRDGQLMEAYALCHSAPVEIQEKGWMTPKEGCKHIYNWGEVVE